MLTQPVIDEITRAIQANPGQTCYNLENGIIVSLQGDTSCGQGEMRRSTTIKVGGTDYDVYLGGTREVAAE